MSQRETGNSWSMVGLFNRLRFGQFCHDLKSLRCLYKRKCLCSFLSLIILPMTLWKLATRYVTPNGIRRNFYNRHMLPRCFRVHYYLVISAFEIQGAKSFIFGDLTNHLINAGQQIGIQMCKPVYSLRIVYNHSFLKLFSKDFIKTCVLQRDLTSLIIPSLSILDISD